MVKVLVLVEGNTEDAFVTAVLQPFLMPRQTYIHPVILTTKRLASGKKMKGGVSAWPKIRKDIRRLLGDSSATCVTTLIDYYGFPRDAPGMSDRPTGPDPYARVSHVEEQIAADVDDPRFYPYLALHEFEALVLAADAGLSAVAPATDIADTLRALTQVAGGPELVDENQPPSKRIVATWNSYQKLLHGPLATAAVPLYELTQSCPHFGSWVSHLEGLN